MPKSKNNKSHKDRLNKYKSNKKKEQDIFKKKMIDNYIKMQQEAVAEKESHTSTQEVAGPDINIDELSQIENWEPVSVAPEVSNFSGDTGTFEGVETIINVDVEPVMDVIEENTKTTE